MSPNIFDSVNLKPLHHFIFEKNLIKTYQLQSQLQNIQQHYEHLKRKDLNSAVLLHRKSFHSDLLPNDLLHNDLPKKPKTHICEQPASLTLVSEAQEVARLIYIFNLVFKNQNTILVKGETEPEYFPATATLPARIVFAHGYLSSALHEISHWTIAGQYRRTLSDFGYWYAPDGRNKEQQKAFEQLEIKPQALECLFTLTLNKTFNTSKDNLNANFDLDNNSFEVNVLQQVNKYISEPMTMPNDAIRLLTILTHLWHDNNLAR